MREFKFRVWDTKRKEWVHGPGYEPSLFGECILLGMFLTRPQSTMNNPSHVSIEELNDCVALQFTGLKDKNGKDIYEGDILRSEYTISANNLNPPEQEVLFEAVVWGEGMFLVGIDPLGEVHDGKFEVVGNIYENADLINV